MSRIGLLLKVIATGTCVALMACGGAEPEPGTPAEPGGKTDWLGNGEMDTACSWDWQCSSDKGLVCRPVNFNFDPEYRCSLRGEERSPCIKDEHCLEGMSCNSVSRSLIGMVENAGLCIPGRKCSQDTDCDGDDGLRICRPTRWKNGQPDFYCRDLGLPGNACGEDSDCSDGLRCADIHFDIWGQLYRAGSCEPDPWHQDG